jgi:small subunit ribosomal protein S21
VGAVLVVVTVTEEEGLEKALKRFKAKCDKEGIKRDIKRQRAFEKPSEKRRRKLRKAEAKLRKRVAKQKRNY